MNCNIVKINQKTPLGSISGCISGGIISVSLKQKMDVKSLKITPTNCDMNKITILILRKEDKFWIEENC